MKVERHNSEITAYEEKLAPYLERNPYSKVGTRGKRLYVLTPWNDDSLALLIQPKSATELITALNTLVLPPRFTAIYHLDSNTMEYIYALLEPNDPCYSRAFKFTLAGKSYSCRFAKASERLLALSKLFRRTGKQSLVDYRNLLLLREYVQFKERKRASLEDYFCEKPRTLTH